MPDGADRSGIFLTMARANHSCMSNVEHQFVERQGVKRLNSCRDIEAGEELSSVLPKPPICYSHR